MRHALLAVHVVLVVAALGYFLVALALGSEGANIGAGLGLLALGALGLPWSLAVWAFDTTGAIAAVVFVAAALLNLGLHASLWRRRAQPVLKR